MRQARGAGGVIAGNQGRAVSTAAGVDTGYSKRGVSVNEKTEQYRHKTEAVQRPEVGVQDQFQAKKPPRTFRYDSSLDPAMTWDEQGERDLGEWLLGLIDRAAKEGETAVFAVPQEWKGGGVRVTSTPDAVAVLKNISRPFLNWAGKAERHQITVPSVPLFVHERHSTKAILDGIQHRKARGSTFELFSDPNMDIRGNLEAYEHKGLWQNRMILGDSLSVMSSLLEYEGLGGQVQMIYIDPPYGVKFGSNFQPFVRKREVKHGGDEDMTREPEMVKAYRDMWEIGIHSYLSYLRDRLALARDLLSESGSVFVQISDDNFHHVRELLDETFGTDNFCSVIAFYKTTGQAGKLLPQTKDFLLWYARDVSRVRFRQLFVRKNLAEATTTAYDWIETPSGERRPLTVSDREQLGALIDGGSKVCALSALTSSGALKQPEPNFEFGGKTWRPPPGSHWKTTNDGMIRLKANNRLAVKGNTLRYVRYFSDFPLYNLHDIWEDVAFGGFVSSEKLYVVQTPGRVVERCMLMTTDPGDLVLDPTCGSGTTAYVAEQWGRRWITIDTSRVPLALARQRLLTATFPYYELKDPGRGPASGFVYKRKQNRKGEEVGGLVPHITLKSIANDEPPAMEVLVDRPEEIAGVTRVTGPFVVEATIAPVQPLEGTGDGEHAVSDAATHLERMTEVLRQSKTLRLPGNRELTLAGIRRTVDAEYLHAEAREGDRRIAIVFGPQDGAVSQSLVYEGAREAHYLKYDGIYFFGFAVESEARKMIEEERKLRIPAAYVAVTPDVAMSDLLKTTRASEIFSVTGLPDFKVKKTAKKGPEGQPLYQVELEGLDVFDPESLETDSVDGQSVPCWMLDTDYDGMSFYASQVFFPKTSAWDNLQKSLKASFEESVWEHLAGTTSEPFALGERRRVAVKVIDERGNELLKVLDVEG
jgi:adenine-specific DNA-methyltransferase